MKYKKNYISREAYEVLMKCNIPYEGFVIGLGYVFPEVVVLETSKNKNHNFVSTHNNFSSVVIKGLNNSSLTIKTDATNINLDSDFDFGGNIILEDTSNLAIGVESKIVGSVVPILGGIGGSANKQSVLFLGGEYAGYWYHYIGGDIGARVVSGVDVSIGGGKNLFLGINHKPKRYSPEGYEGFVLSGQVEFGFKALLGANINLGASHSFDESWTTISLGSSGSVGLQFGMFEGFGIGADVGVGGAKLIDSYNIKPTKERSSSDIYLNWGEFFVKSILLPF